MENDSKDNALCMNETQLVSKFWASVTEFCFASHDVNLEYQTVHLLVQLMSKSSLHVHVWDALRRTRLLCVVVQTLGSQVRLQNLVLRSDYIQDYMRVIELVSEANPRECMRYLIMEEFNFSGIHSFLPLLMQLSLFSKELDSYRFCIGSFVRTVSFLLSDANNCRLLSRMNPSPIQMLIESLSNVPSDRYDAHLLILRGILQILLYTSNFTKLWVEEFSLFSGPSVCLSTIVQYCSHNEDPNTPLNEESTVLFDILSLLLSLPDSGRGSSYSLYLYLRASHWESEDIEPDQSVYSATIGLFGLRVILRASLAAAEYRPTLFSYLAQLVIRAIRVGDKDIVIAGLISHSLVNVIARYIRMCTEKENSNLGSVIMTIVRLSTIVCSSSHMYTKQKHGADALCAFIVELVSSSSSRALTYGVQTVMTLASFHNEELFFTMLVSAHLFNELDKRLQWLFTSDEILLVLELMHEVCIRVPSLQKEMVPTLGTVISLIRREVHSGPKLLLKCSELISLVMLNSENNVSSVQVILQAFIMESDFQSSGSIVSGCWGLQTCIKAVKGNANVRTYFVSQIENILTCLYRLCENMKNIFLSELKYYDLCELFNEILTHYRYQKDTTGTQKYKDKYLLQCDFLLLILHLLTLLQANAEEVSSKDLSSKLKWTISQGPFLHCRLYTSIVVRAFISMSSVSSYAMFDEIFFLKEKLMIFPVTCQNLICEWKFQSSYGDNLFTYNMQRIVYPEYLQSLQGAIKESSKTASSALLGSSITQLFIEIFSNSLENICLLVGLKTILLLAELFTIAIDENHTYMLTCFNQLVTVISQLGTCGIHQNTIFYLFQMCLRKRNETFMEYDQTSTRILLSTWRNLLHDSLPCSQPKFFFEISIGFPTITIFHTPAINRVKREFNLHGGVDIPIQLTIPKPDNCISSVLWFLVESNPSSLQQEGEFILLSHFFDQNKISLLLFLSDRGKLKLRLTVRVNRQLRSKDVSIPNIRVPTCQWCMISMSIFGNKRDKASLLSKMHLNIQISLYTTGNQFTPLLKEVMVHVEVSLGVFKSVDHLFQGLNMISMGMARVPVNDYPPQILFGSLGLFGGSLSKLEVALLCAMGSDNLFSFAFMDKNFVVSLYPMLANIVQEEKEKKEEEEEKKEEGFILTKEMILLSSMWIQQEIHNTDGQVVFSGTAFPFNKYYNKERMPLIVGISEDGLYLRGNVERWGSPIDSMEKYDNDNITFFHIPSERLTKNVLITSIPLRLSVNENNMDNNNNNNNNNMVLGVIWAKVNGPRFRYVSPLYSMLDAIGGIPFFSWLTSLQTPCSDAFEEAWECVCAIIQKHSAESLLSQLSSSHGGRCDNIVILLRTLLHKRIGISEKMAISLCKAIGYHMIVRTDLLPLMLDFTLWSKDVGAFRVILQKLQDYLKDKQYGYFNTQILRTGIHSHYSSDDCYALEEFLLHLMMCCSNSDSDSNSNNNWDDSLISMAIQFIIPLCETTFHLRRIVQTVIFLVISEEKPTRSAIEWALGLLGVVHSLLQLNRSVKLQEEDLASDVVILLKCSNEAIRCMALSLWSCIEISKEQLDLMINEYFLRKDSSLDDNKLCLSKGELDIIISVIEQSTSIGDTAQARKLLIFLIAFLLHMKDEFQIRVITLLNHIIKTKGSLAYDLVFPSETGNNMEVSLQRYLLGLLSRLKEDHTNMMKLLIELLTHISLYMIEVSWSKEGKRCGDMLCDVILIILKNVWEPKCLDQNHHRRKLDIHKIYFVVHELYVPCLHTFALLASKGFSESFAQDYLLFLRTIGSIVILLDSCESDSIDFPEGMINHHTWTDQLLAKAYFTRFGKSLSLSGRHNGVCLALPLFECTHKLFFGLQTQSFVTIMPKKRLNRLCEELLLLQWKVVSSILYNAEKNDDDIVRELILLHLSHSGSIDYGFNYSTWEKQEMIVQPPSDSKWKYLLLSSNTLVLEVLKTSPGDVMKESAPWLVVLRAASSLLHSSIQENTPQLSMALSLCRLIRFNSNIWSLIKGGVSPSSVMELDATLKIDYQNSLDETSNNIWRESLWGIELTRNGVAALEKSAIKSRNFAFSLLQRCGSHTPPTFITVDPNRIVHHHGQTSMDKNQFESYVYRSVTLYKKTIEEDGNAILAAHAAYRFSLLPWWGYCIHLYTQSTVPLNRWELDHFMGTEWQRIRLRRFIHNVRITDMRENTEDQFLQPIYREDMRCSSSSSSSIDDVKLLEIYSITAIPQLLTSRIEGRNVFRINCELILPMDRISIILNITSHNISYVVECFQNGLTELEKESEGIFLNEQEKKKSSILGKVYDPLAQLLKTFQSKHEIPCLQRVIDISTVRAVWPRRNLLQPCALELLLSTGETLFIAFNSEEIKEQVSNTIRNVARRYLDKKLFLTDNNLSMWRNWWCEGRISNFHYLMFLNFAAGRSYGDLRQYPVFPHVIADFVSDTLDLTSAASFRRFHKPMGAQTVDREQKAIEKYNDIATIAEGEGNSVSMDLMPHHYGSHYSPLGGALHYLVRVQPFTNYFVDMNSTLDDAGRVFDSMAAAYRISTGKDVKELLPELYCLPDVFINSNCIPFGTKQDGVVVNNVQLPPWASTPRELTFMLREALESRYTSENLHFWIDLIFGYKQRGKEAVAAVNVFHPLTYEGSVDLFTITDPVLRSSHQTQIDCFGQVPLQLFTHPHKPRIKSTDSIFIQSPCPTLRYNASHSKSCVILHPDKLIPVQYCKVDGTVIIFPRSKHTITALGAEESGERKFSQSLSQTRPLVLPKNCLPFKVVNDQVKNYLSYRENCILLLDGKDISREISSFHVSNGKINTFAVDSPTVYVGMESGAIHVIKINGEEWNEIELLMQDGNGEPINMIDVAEKILHGESKLTRVRGHVKRRVCVLYGHTASVTSLSVSSEWGILVSSAEDNNVAVWDINRYLLLRTISSYPSISVRYQESLLTKHIWQHRCQDENDWHYNLISVNAKEGDIILAGSSKNGGTHAVQLYSLNGSFLASSELANGPATALLSVGGVVFVGYGTSVRVLKEINLQLICELTHPALEDCIESLALNPCGTLLAACDRKATLVTWKVAS